MLSCDLKLHPVNVGPSTRPSTLASHGPARVLPLSPPIVATMDKLNQCISASGCSMLHMQGYCDKR